MENAAECIACTEMAIDALSSEDRNRMATLSLVGYKIYCAVAPFSHNVWWNARGLRGEHLGAHGGLNLTRVIERVWETYCRESF